MQGQLAVWPASDTQLRGVGVLDSTGTVVVATESALVGVNLAYRGFVQEALRGKTVISDVYISEAETGSVPSFAVLAPMLGANDKQIGVAAFWIRAAALADMMKQSNELAGPGSFAILFDRFGIRIAHTFLDEIVYRPGLTLAPEVLEAQVAEERFGPQTRQLLLDVREVSPEFALGGRCAACRRVPRFCAGQPAVEPRCCAALQNRRLDDLLPGARSRCCKTRSRA